MVFARGFVMREQPMYTTTSKPKYEELYVLALLSKYEGSSLQELTMTTGFKYFPLESILRQLYRQGVVEVQVDGKTIELGPVAKSDLCYKLNSRGREYLSHFKIEGLANIPHLPEVPFAEFIA
jgi:hypothetical protein